jgi:H+/Cl- antiporter ClcA
MVALYVFTGALCGVVLYWCARKVRTFIAWSQGDEPPKEKAIVFMAMIAILCGIAGYMFYDLVQMMSGCSDTWVKCFITATQQKQ